MKTIPLKHLISVLILVGITVIVYLPGLGGPMIGDDFPGNGVGNEEDHHAEIGLKVLQNFLEVQ